MSRLIPQVNPGKLRAARVHAGYNQRELADLIGLTKQQVSNIENGYSMITTPQLALWARSCGVENPLDLYSDAVADAFSTRKKTAEKVQL